jgi:hypothetical protein
MIEVLPRSTRNVVAVRVNGKLIHKDYQQFIPKLEAILEQYGSLRCYCEMVNFEGITWQALMDEIQFDVKHCAQIERCAIVSDSAWSHWMTDFSKMVFQNAQIECFTSSQVNEAWDWLSQDVEYAGAAQGASRDQTSGTTGTTSSSGKTGRTTGQGTRQTTGQNAYGTSSAKSDPKSCGSTGTGKTSGGSCGSTSGSTTGSSKKDNKNN